MAITPLSEIQKNRVSRLQKQLALACSSGDLNAAKKIIIDLKPIFLNTGNNAKFYISSLRYYEAVMDHGNKSVALEGIRGIRERSNKNTRVHLEASTLLAICYLRIGAFDLSEPIIKEVLKNDKVITSPKKRAEYRKEIISRFDEEALIFGLSETNPVKMTLENVENQIIDNIGKHEDELYENIGLAVPENAKNILLRIDMFSKKQLPTAERIALPSGQEVVENKKVGKRIQRFISRSLYNSFCNKESEIYKSMISGNLTNLNTIITTAIIETFYKFSIGISALIGVVAATIIKHGIDYICSISKPKNLIDYR